MKYSKLDFYLLRGLLVLGVLFFVFPVKLLGETRFEKAIAKEENLVVLEKYLSGIEHRIFAIENWSKIESQFHNGVDPSPMGELLPEWDLAKSFQSKYVNVLESFRSKNSICSAFRKLDSLIHSSLQDKVDSYLIPSIDDKQSIILESQIEILFQLTKKLFRLHRLYRQTNLNSDTPGFCYTNEQLEAKYLRDIHIQKMEQMILGARGVWQVMYRTDQLKIQQKKMIGEFQSDLPIYAVTGVAYLLFWEFIVTTPLQHLVTKSLLSARGAAAIEVSLGLLIPLIGFSDSIENLIIKEDPLFIPDSFEDLNYDDEINQIYSEFQALPKDIWGLAKVMEFYETQTHVMKVRNTPRKSLLPTINKLIEHYGGKEEALANLRSKKEQISQRILDVTP